MHIPDGFLDPISCAVTYLIMIIYGIYAYLKTKGHWTTDNISQLTVLASAIFVAQMLNWPIPGGTSLHFVGGALAGILMNPYFGFFIMFLVLFVQCIIFHDGGITTLGANVLNMAIIDVLVGYALYKLMSKLGKENKNYKLIGAFLGGWIGITLAGIAAGIEIGISPNFAYTLGVTVPVMAIWHFVLGIIEGIITAAVLAYLLSKAPHMVKG